MDLSGNSLDLELMWEGVESFYFDYLAVLTYIRRLDGWHPKVETTILLDLRGRSVRCYYDKYEMQLASEASLPNFLNPKWVERFLSHSRTLLEISDAFVRETHLKNTSIERRLLIDRLTRGSRIMYDTLLAFHVTQPQYSWGIGPYILSILPNISDEKKQEVIALLSQSGEPTLLTKEEDAWRSLVANIKERGIPLPREPDASIAADLDDHARIYGLASAADGQSPPDRNFLYSRLKSDFSRNDLLSNRDAGYAHLKGEKAAVIKEYGISDEVVRVCETLAHMSHIRLETRLRGWMPVENIFVNELIPELARFLPYTPEQLESCTPDELAGLINGAPTPIPEELDKRREQVVIGTVKGEEVLWTGRDAVEKLQPLLPSIDYRAREIKGQAAMRGKARGPCHIISWELDVSAKQIEEMPHGAVLVAGQTRPQLMGAIRKACAIVTDEGGLLSHAAIVSRELRIPCVIGTKYATKILKQGTLVEVDGDNGIVRIID